MEAFVQIVEQGSLTEAASKMGLSSPMVGKHLRALEEHLGASLLMRSTRRQNLTEFGRVYYERCKIILEEIRLAEEKADDLRQAPRGRLRISAPVSFGTEQLASELAEFMAIYTDITVELILNDRVIDLLGEGFDAAIRIGHLPDSSLISRALAPYKMMIAATPDYLKAKGVPETPADLPLHHCLGFTHWHTRGGWRLGRKDVAQTMLPVNRFECNHGPALRMVALRDAGLVMQPHFLLQEDVNKGKLVSVLEAFIPDAKPMQIVFLKERQQQPKIRALIDFITNRFS